MQMAQALEDLKRPGLTAKDRADIDGRIALFNRMADESDVEFIPGTSQLREIQG